MFWRLLIVLTKSALMVAALELLSPAVEAIGLQFRFIVKVASAISHTTAMPYKEAEVLFLFFLVTAILEIVEFAWGLITG